MDSNVDKRWIRGGTSDQSEDDFGRSHHQPTRWRQFFSKFLASNIFYYFLPRFEGISNMCSFVALVTYFSPYQLPQPGTLSML